MKVNRSKNKKKKKQEFNKKQNKNLYKNKIKHIHVSIYEEKKRLEYIKMLLE